MQTRIINEILSEVKAELNKIFGQEMVFGFVCGGFSKGYADESHDVDIFVCLKKKISKKNEKRYLQWYFDLHERYGIKPDYNYPGEIVTRKRLVETLEILKDLKLTLIIEDVQTKKAIIWADMITSITAAETGTNIKLLHKIKKEYKKYPNQWKREVLSLISKEEKKNWEKKSHLLIMEHFMRYPKYDGRNLRLYYE